MKGVNSVSDEVTQQNVLPTSQKLKEAQIISPEPNPPLISEQKPVKPSPPKSMMAYSTVAQESQKQED